MVERTNFRSVMYAVAFVVGVIVFGAAGYLIIQPELRAAPLDAAYMAVITVHRAAKHECSAFLRMHKPDGDVTYRQGQLEHLLKECGRMLTDCVEPMCALLLSIKHVIETAIDRATTVKVVAS